MWSAIPEVLPFFKARPQPQGGHDAPFTVPPKTNPPQALSPLPPPSVRVTLERAAYRPGDTIVATIVVLNHALHGPGVVETSRGVTEAVLMEDLVVGVRGIEKLDPQWLLTPRIAPGSKLRKGERTILELPPTSIVSNILVRRGSSRTYQIRTTLPNVLPPSYRGTAVQYIYYLSVKVNWSPALIRSENRVGYQAQYPAVEVRTTFSIWTMPDKSGLSADDLQSAGHYGLGGIVPMSTADMEIQWREDYGDSDWAWAADNLAIDDENGSVVVSENGRSMAVSENGNGYTVSGRGDDDIFLGSPPSPSGYARGKSYNIRIDDQILVRFSPRNPQSIYYFGDVVSGTLSFFHEEGARRCLEVSVSLETREQLSPTSVHPSRKNAPTINKVQSEYSEVVADILNTHFIFSIPVDGPASFCTPLLSLQWILRFEFVASPSNVNWSMYESPLTVEERERGEWSMPILVHAPLPKSKIPGAIRERPASPKKDDWMCSPRAAGGSVLVNPRWTEQSSPGRRAGDSSNALADRVRT